MDGKAAIYCNSCGGKMSSKTGTCQKCNRAQCHIRYKGNKFYKDRNNIGLSYMTAIDMLLAMNREGTKFDSTNWLAGSIKLRSVEVLIEKWLSLRKAEAKTDELSPGTIKREVSQIKTHIIPLLGSKDVRTIGYHELEVFKHALPKHLKHRTKRDILYTVHNFFKWLWQTGVIEAIPPFPVVNVTDSKKRTTISREISNDVLAMIPEEHRDVYELEGLTGIRPGETCALKIKDYNRGEKTITIQRTWTAGNHLRETDKEGHKLSIPLSTRSIEIIDNRIRGRFPDDFILINPVTKRHYTIQFLAKWWKVWTGLSISHYEGTRHYYATQIVKLTKNVKTAQRLLRHADIRSTMHYVHEDIEELREVVELHMDNLRIITKKDKALKEQK